MRSTGTRPERRTRAAVEWLNVAYRTNTEELPGKPDLVFDELRKAVFVNGCFWHGHRECKTRQIVDELSRESSFWREKFRRNAERDAGVLAQLRRLGWEVLVLWECETRDGKDLRARLGEFLGERAA